MAAIEEIATIRPLPALAHPRQRRLQGEEGAGQVDVDLVAPVLLERPSRRGRSGRRSRRWRPPLRPGRTRPRPRRAPRAPPRRRDVPDSAPAPRPPASRISPAVSQRASSQVAGGDRPALGRPAPGRPPCRSRRPAPVTSAQRVALMPRARASPYRRQYSSGMSAGSLYQYQVQGSWSKSCGRPRGVERQPVPADRQQLVHEGAVGAVEREALAPVGPVVRLFGHPVGVLAAVGAVAPEPLAGAAGVHLEGELLLVLGDREGAGVLAGAAGRVGAPGRRQRLDDLAPVAFEDLAGVALPAAPQATLPRPRRRPRRPASAGCR